MQKYEAICSRTFLKCETSYSGWMRVHPGGGVKAMGGADSGGRREGERMSNLAVSQY